MPPPRILAPRILALDVGDKRIGLAITDELGLTAQPLFTLHRAAGKNGLRADLKAIARFIRQHKVEVVVVGNPLHADGSPSPQSAKAQEFAAALGDFVREAHPALTLHLLDERLTTREAHALLDRSSAAGNVPRGTIRGERQSRQARLDRSAFIDQVAAVLLLEAYLSGGRPALLPVPDV